MSGHHLEHDPSSGDESFAPVDSGFGGQSQPPDASHAARARGPKPQSHAKRLSMIAPPVTSRGLHDRALHSSSRRHSMHTSRSAGSFHARLSQRLAELEGFLLSEFSESVAQCDPEGMCGGGTVVQSQAVLATKTDVIPRSQVPSDIGNLLPPRRPQSLDLKPVEENAKLRRVSKGSAETPLSTCESRDHVLLRSSTQMFQPKASNVVRQTRAKELIREQSYLPNLEMDSSCCRKRCSQTVVDTIFSTLVVFNCLTIGLSTDLYPNWTGWPFLDGTFAVVFLSEAIIKACVLRKNYIFGPDRWWHLFEACLVFLGLVDIAMHVGFAGMPDAGSDFVLPRLLRLARIMRIVRLTRLKIFGELRMMVKGAVGGLKTLWWALILMFGPFYMFAVVFRQTLGHRYDEGNGAEAFRTVPVAFFTLFRCLVLQDCSDESGRSIVALMVTHYGWIYSWVYGALGMFMIFGLFNVITAIFIESVISAARHDEGMQRRDRLRSDEYFVEKMMELTKVLHETQQDMMGGSSVDVADFENKSLDAMSQDASFLTEVVAAAFEKPSAQQIFADLNIAEDETRHLQRLVDIDGDGEVDIGELFDSLARVRGSPCKSDVITLTFMVEHLRDDLDSQRQLIEAALSVQPQGVGIVAC